jgi:hypothetical protein
VGAVWQMHGYILSSSGRFRLYLQFVASRNNQGTSLGAHVLVEVMADFSCLSCGYF